MKKLIPLVIGAAIASVPVFALAQSMPAWKSYMQTGNTANIVPSAGTDNSVAAWLAKKVDTTNGQLQNPSIQGGSVSGMDVSAAIVNGDNNTLASYLASKPSRPRYIFFGGADNLYLAANLAPTLINSGKVGLYQHTNGMAGLSSDQRAALQATFAPTGSSIVTGGGDAMAELGIEATTPSPYTPGTLAFHGGKFPREANANTDCNGTWTTAAGVVLQNYCTTSNLANIKVAIDSGIQNGLANFALVETPNGQTQSLSEPFATSDYWANVRAAALYGGALAIDCPPSFALWQGTPFLNMLVQQIQWARANNLRVTVILSPWSSKGDGQPDTDIWNNTARYIDYLIRNGGVPTSYVVETYCGCTTVNPLTGSSDLSTSMDHLVAYLETAPVAPPGTANPQSPVVGAASEADAFTPISLRKTVDSANTSPTYEQVLGDLNRPDNIANVIGSLGYQSADNVQIVAGQIGYRIGSTSKLDIFLSSSSSFVSQIPLTLSGSKAGNPEIGVITDDYWVHIFDPYEASLAEVGIALGPDENAPTIVNDGSNGMIIMGSLHIASGGAAIFQNNWTMASSNILFSGTGTNGIQFQNSDNSASTWINGDGSGNVALGNSAWIKTNGTFQVASYSTAQVKAITNPADGEIVNDSELHQPVIFENGSWYPIQLGTALQ